MFMRLPKHQVKKNKTIIEVQLQNVSEMRRFFYKSILKFNLKTTALVIFTRQKKW
jgi:hypothetical protein